MLINNIKSTFLKDVENEQDGDFEYFSKNWCRYTKDPYILL